MALKITDECINCGACEPECPNNAIYDSGEFWNYNKGTCLKGVQKDYKNDIINSDVLQTPISNEYYYIVPNKCTECVGFHDEPQCAAVCPVECCIIDEKNIESRDILLNKKKWMHK